MLKGPFLRCSNSVKLSTISILTAFFIALSLATLASAHELVLQANSPDSALDTLNQSIAVNAELGSGWQLSLGNSYRMVRNGGFTGLDAASVQKEWQLGKASSLGIVVGRSAANWSPWQGNSVVLSGHAPGVDQLQYTFQQGNTSIDTLVGRLDGVDRYLLAHRLSITLGPLTGSIGETMVTSGKFVNNLVTLLPWSYYWTQWVGLQSWYIGNDEVNANVFLQALYIGENGMLLGAELLVDDMPQWWGVKQLFQAAGQLRAELPVGDAGRLTAQYSRVNNYTYAFQDPFGNYTHHGYSLGSPWGPDNDELLLTYEFPRTRIGLTSVGLSLRRKGEGDYFTVWEDTGGYDAHRDKQFLSGVVEHTQLISATAVYPVGDIGDFKVRFGVGPIQNAKNIAGYNKVHPEGEVELRYRFGK